MGEIADVFPSNLQNAFGHCETCITCVINQFIVESALAGHVVYMNLEYRL